MMLDDIKVDLFNMLESDLSSHLYYHGIHHTRDVHNVCLFYIDHYNLDAKSAELLEIAAVGHDVGFTKTYKDHEEVGAKITAELMRQYGYVSEDVEQVVEMIMATKIPQNPGAFLSELLCDADLDYLGRDDFKTIGATLKKEWQHYDIFPNLDEVFDTIQISFLSGHHFHNPYAIKHRAPVKLKNLQALEGAADTTNSLTT